MLTQAGDQVAALEQGVQTLGTNVEENKPLPQELESFTSEVQNLVTAIDEQSSENVNGVTSILTTPLSKIGGALDQMQATISGFSQQVGDVQQGLSNLESAIPKWLTWGAVILTVVLLWFALSQAALFVLGWRGFSGLDILPRGQKELKAAS